MDFQRPRAAVCVAPECATSAGSRHTCIYAAQALWKLVSKLHPQAAWADWLRLGPDDVRGISEERLRSELPTLAQEAMVHARIVANFALLARTVKLYPEDVRFAWHLPNRNTPYFRRYFFGRLNHDVFAIAQHHRIPTTLLDWSFNPLAALFFAAREAYQSKTVAAQLEVWALSWRYLNKAEAKIKRVTPKPGITPFLDAQEGLFTWYPSSYLHKLRHGTYPAHNDIIHSDARELEFGDALRDE